MVNGIQDDRVISKPPAQQAPQTNKNRIRRQDEPKELAIDIEERDIDSHVICPVRQGEQSYGRDALSVRYVFSLCLASKEQDELLDSKCKGDETQCANPVMRNCQR